MYMTDTDVGVMVNAGFLRYLKAATMLANVAKRPDIRVSRYILCLVCSSHVSCVTDHIAKRSIVILEQ